jgi:hypothetical protein
MKHGQFPDEKSGERLRALRQSDQSKDRPLQVKAGERSTSVLQIPRHDSASEKRNHGERLRRGGFCERQTGFPGAREGEVR